MRKTSNRFPFLSMQQYFVNEPLETGMDYVFDDKQAHHAKTVVRLNNEVVRLVYDGKDILPLPDSRENSLSHM